MHHFTIQSTLNMVVFNAFLDCVTVIFWIGFVGSFPWSVGFPFTDQFVFYAVFSEFPVSVACYVEFFDYFWYVYFWVVV